MAATSGRPATSTRPLPRLFAEWRERLGLRAPQPTTVIVTASGRIDPRAPGASTAPDVPVLLVTTTEGAALLRGRLPDAVELVVAGLQGHVDGEPGHVDERALMTILAEHDLDLVVCEGGPGLIGGLVAAGLVDEMFLTIAPQIAGRAPDMPRLSMVEGHGFEIGSAPWAELASVLRSGDHLFLRYRLNEPGR